MECTTDACDPVRGACVHVVGCDDGNTCTADFCNVAGGCQHVPQPTGFPCSDGNACTTYDLCTGPVEARVCAGSGGSCDDGNPCTADRCDPATGCVHDGPADPSQEICNGVDDDCDGLVDERETLMGCAVRPVVIRDAGVLKAFTVTCRFTAACDAAAPAPPEPIGTVWLSAADTLFNPSDNLSLPDPFAHCDTAIVEDEAKRLAGDAAVTFVFDEQGNGVCGTTGGGRPGLVKALAGVPDGKLARVCVKWRQPGTGDTERCGIVLVKHDAATEPQPLSGGAGDEDGGLLRPAP
jgi:hypothetical protein